MSHRGTGSARKGDEADRICVGCRDSDSRGALLRFVLMGDPPALVPDIRRRAPGRGVSVHPRYSCLVTAVKTGAFKRAFKREVVASAPEMARHARGQYQRRVDGLLQASRRAGHLALGTDAVRDAMTRRTASLLVVADDAAGRRSELVAQAQRLESRCIVYGRKEHLGELFGRSPVGVIAVRDDRIAGEIRRAAQSAAELAEDA